MIPSPTIWQRIFWSLGCALLGVSLACLSYLAMAFLPDIPVILPGLQSGQDWSGLIVLFLCACGSVICGLGGAIAGGWRPGRTAVLVTFGCSLAADVASFLFCLINPDGGRFVALYFVLTAIKGAVVILLWRCRNRRACEDR